MASAEEISTMINSSKSPHGGRKSSEAASDDEISVIAVIKKGTSGIPKRARYHYIRELPLMAVKSFKKSVHRPIREIPREFSLESTLTRPLKPPSDITAPKKPKIIELGDETSKLELRRQFNIPEKESDEEQSVNSAQELTTCTGDGNPNIGHKLPPGTILIKQEPRTPSRGNNEKTDVTATRENDNGNNSVGAMTTTNTTTSTGSSSNSSESSSASSFGSGSSSGGFRSGSASPSIKVKRLQRGTRANIKKTLQDMAPRRNPARRGSKKVPAVAVTTPVSTLTSTATQPRQRQRLMTTRTQSERNYPVSQTGIGTRRTKPITMPYMNTRSVTRKLYTVGATYQAPTRRDETEWREWPVHGMHERPIFHPQVGLAAEYIGRVYWTSNENQESGWKYREVLQDVNAEHVEIVSVDPRAMPTTNKEVTATPGDVESSDDDSFGVCMHDTLHSVLAYCAQVMAPGYRHILAKKKQSHDPATRPEQAGESESQKIGDADPEGLGVNRLDLNELENSSISDETLMKMSSIYKKFLPVEDLDASPSMENNTTDQSQNCHLMKNNANETSEIAKILSEYTESLKNTSLRSDSGRSLGSRAISAKINEKEVKVLQNLESSAKLSPNDRSIPGSAVSENLPEAGEESKDADYWLEELLVDTSLLYCVATGVNQSDLSRYVDTLDSKQSLQWINSTSRI